MPSAWASMADDAGAPDFRLPVAWDTYAAAGRNDAEVVGTITPQTRRRLPGLGGGRPPRFGRAETVGGKRRSLLVRS